jgi:hypothetical protein
MPKNTTGGNKAKGRANSESERSKKNGRLVEDLVWDLRAHDALEGVHIGRVTRKFGNGRFEVFIVETLKTGPCPRLLNAPLAGRMRGRGKKDVWVDVDTIVVLGSTEMGGSLEFEIIGTISPDRVRDIRKIRPDLDARLFLSSASADAEASEAVIFEKDETKDAEDEIDLDTI